MQVAPIMANNISDCVSQISPCVPKNESPDEPEATDTNHSKNSYNTLIVVQTQTVSTASQQRFLDNIFPDE